MFRTAWGNGDDERQDKAANPQPSLLGVEPRRVPAGSAAVVVTLQGQGFIPASVAQVSWPRRGPSQVIPRTTTFVGPTEIKVVLEAENLAEVGEIELTVVNSEPGGGKSSPITVDMHDVPQAVTHGTAGG